MTLPNYLDETNEEFHLASSLGLDVQGPNTTKAFYRSPEVNPSYSGHLPNGTVTLFPTSTNAEATCAPATEEEESETQRYLSPAL